MMPATHTRAFDPYAFAPYAFDPYAFDPYAFNRRASLSARRGLLLSLSLACLLLATLSGCARVLDPGPRAARCPCNWPCPCRKPAACWIPTASPLSWGA